jgi:hypothetical protein
MLVLADANGLGIDLDQFGQRVLQAAGDGDRAAQAHVQIRELLRGQLRGRIHRGAGLGDDDLGHVQLGAQLDQVGGELVGFAAGGAVADGDQRHIVLLAHLRQRMQAAVPVAAGLVGIDHAGVEELAGLVHHRHLDAGAQAGVEAQGGAGAGGGGEEQILEVAPEDADGFFLGLLAQLAEQFQLEVQGDLDAPGPAHGFAQPGIGAAAFVTDAEVAGDTPLAGVGAGGAAVGGVGVQPQLQAQEAFVAAAEQGQGPVGGDGLDGLRGSRTSRGTWPQPDRSPSRR